MFSHEYGEKFGSSACEGVVGYQLAGQSAVGVLQVDTHYFLERLT